MTVQRVISSVANNDVSETRATNSIHAGECICTDVRNIARGRSVGVASGEIYGHSIQSIVECDAGITVARDSVIAGHPSNSLKVPKSPTFGPETPKLVAT